MATNELRQRVNWQTQSGGKACSAESIFFKTLKDEFDGGDFCVQSKPSEFSDIYSSVRLPQPVLDAIYQPERTWRHGIRPDYAIRNKSTDKTLYVEVKRQDGWVEGKKPSAGRGNAHERSCKYFAPGLLRVMRQHGKLGEGVLPFWVVFQGDITRDPKRVREITLWYEGYCDHFFFWINPNEPRPLLDHFNRKLKPLLL